jgi:hypothetical protein
MLAFLLGLLNIFLYVKKTMLSEIRSFLHTSYRFSEKASSLKRSVSLTNSARVRFSLCPNFP